MENKMTFNGDVPNIANGHRLPFAIPEEVQVTKEELQASKNIIEGALGNVELSKKPTLFSLMDILDLDPFYPISKEDLLKAYLAGHNNTSASHNDIEENFTHLDVGFDEWFKDNYGSN